MKDSVLIALDKLDIGGVETFVVNQAKYFKEQGKDVVIIASKGIYAKELKKYDIKYIEYDFTNKTYFDIKEINKMISILKKYNITQVHINQIPEIGAIMPACILTNTPYVGYLHMGIATVQDNSLNVFDYFEKQYINYKELFKMFFRNASKIIATTEYVKNYTAKRYNFDKRKVLVKPNPIDITEFNSTRKVKSINKLLYVSRLSEEKKTSIINALDLYKSFKEENPQATLSIAGDGPERASIESYIKENNIQDITFLGSISNVKEVMDQHDLVIGLARVVIEALTMKRIVIVSGYNCLKGIVDSSNIRLLINDNFTGKCLDDSSIEDIIEEIKNLNSKKIEKIVNQNYKTVENKLDIKEVIYSLKETDYKELNKNQIIEDIMKITEIIDEERRKSQKIADDLWKQLETYQHKVKKRYGFMEATLRIVKYPKRAISRLFLKK